MATEDLLDTVTRHQILIQRLSGGEASKVKTGIKRLTRKVKKELGETLTPYKRARYQQILYDLQQYAKNIYDEIEQGVGKYADDFINYEAEFSSDAFTKATGTSFNLPSPNQLRSAYGTNVMYLNPNSYSRTFEELMSSWSRQSVNQFNQILRDGFALGQTSKQMVNQVRQHVSLKGNQIETLIRTGTNHLATVARSETMDENKDLLEGYEWVATLDSRTTFICMSRDGIIYPISNNIIKSPKPPAHYGCRSTIVPEVKKRFDLLADEEESRPSIGSSGVKVIKGKVNYEQWLRRQSKAFQIEVLGKQRQKLFSEQKLPLSRFVDNSGKTLTLSQLRSQDIQFNGMTLSQVVKRTAPEAQRPKLDFGSVSGNQQVRGAAEKILNKELDPLTLAAAIRLPKPRIILSKKDGGYYQPSSKTVMTEILPDGTQKDAVTNHEYGHHIDYEIYIKQGKPNKFKAWSETDPAFIAALKADRVQAGLVPLATRKKKAYELMKEIFKQETGNSRYLRWDFKGSQKGNLSDILDAMTSGLVRGNLGGVGHAKSYWARKGAKEKEVFANMFSIYGTSDWKRVERIAPNMAKRFVEIMKEITK
tara:strand:+ start:13622 stop:15397 length:1776 start_codon:yes stop_codon:yes gene_type:complete